jgi:hypothetical protein
MMHVAAVEFEAKLSDLKTVWEDLGHTAKAIGAHRLALKRARADALQEVFDGSKRTPGPTRLRQLNAYVKEFQGEIDRVAGRRYRWAKRAILSRSFKFRPDGSNLSRAEIKEVVTRSYGSIRACYKSLRSLMPGEPAFCRLLSRQLPWATQSALNGADARSRERALARVESIRFKLNETRMWARQQGYSAHIANAFSLGCFWLKDPHRVFEREVLRSATAIASTLGKQPFPDLARRASDLHSVLSLPSAAEDVRARICAFADGIPELYRDEKHREEVLLALADELASAPQGQYVDWSGDTFLAYALLVSRRTAINIARRFTIRATLEEA